MREIPVDYRDYNKKTYARISGLKCSDDYEAETDNGYYVMQIGSASRTLRGDVRYVIEYDYDLGADFNEGYDEFYMNTVHDGAQYLRGRVSKIYKEGDKLICKGINLSHAFVI